MHVFCGMTLSKCGFLILKRLKYSLAAYVTSYVLPYKSPSKLANMTMLYPTACRMMSNCLESIYDCHKTHYIQ